MFFILEIMQVTFVTVPIVICQQPLSSLRAWARKRSREAEQCHELCALEVHTYLVPAVGF